MMRLLNNELFRSLIETAPDAIVIAEADGKIFLVNHQTEKLFGYTKDELIGKKIELLLPERFRHKHPSQRESYFNNPKVRPMATGYDLFGRKKDGTEIPVEISLSPLITPGGTIVTSAIRDVSQRKQIEAELKKAREQADLANKTKSDFLANMSHEIRTPLTGILGYAEMLIHFCKSDEDRKKYGEKIKRNADNLTELINDILDLSKVEAGALKVEQLTIPLKEEIENSLSLLQDLAEEKNLKLEVVWDKNLPTHIISDPKRLRQILINIIGNAIKFTDTGKVSLFIQLENLEYRKLSFYVQDTGIGIPEKAQANLFKPFIQADNSTTRKYGGTGLGLALSKRLSNLLGGDVTLLESKPNLGSLFKITIDPGTLNPNWESHSNKISNKSDLKSLQILLAEDLEDNIELITHFLKESGAIVSVAKNGKEAVEKATSQFFDLILMDIQMPIMDGLEATKTLRELGINTPIIAITAHAMTEDKEKCKKIGFNNFIAKPINFSFLINQIRELCDKKAHSS